MKLNNTFVLINSGAVAKTRDWENSHAAIETAILNMSWPAESKAGMAIPRIVSIKPGDKYTNERGKVVAWRGEKNENTQKWC